MSEASPSGIEDARRAGRAVPVEDDRHRLELLAHAGAVLARSLEPKETLDAIAATVVPRIADWCRVDLVDGDGVLRRALTFHSDPEKTRRGVELVDRLRAAPDAPGSMAWAVATGRSHLAHFDPPHHFDRIRDRDLLTFAEAIGMRAYFVVPLIARGRTLGAMAALQAESGRAFSPADCAMLAELGQRAALALDTARLYAEAEAARRQAETANRAKDEFLGMLGHELRNPLAPIVLALHLMELRNDQASIEERRIIARQVAHLSRLVDDLLDVSRITQGKVTLQHERIDVRSIVGKALELTLPIYERRLRPIEVTLPSVPVVVSGDEVRLAQIVSNLLINAAKFTPDERRIALELRQDDGAAAAEIIVSDDGIGIPPDLLPHLFDLFVQGRQSIDRQSGGLGLGLAIVKTLVEMHGGSVTAESPGAGQGSTFRLRLPIVVDAGAPEIAKLSSSHATRGQGRILIVDDNADAAETLALLLSTVGYDVRTAADADEALRVIDGFVPAVAILDIGLPGMDGYALAERLRNDGRLPAVKLVALTGYGRAPDRERALRVGFVEHLVKPVEPARLLELLGELVDASISSLE